jgi:hypothetical protein
VATRCGGSLGAFHNAGTFINKTTSGTTTFLVPFNNTVAVTVSSGKLALDFGGTSSGSFTATGAALDFGRGVTLLAGSTVTGGTISFSSGTDTVAATLANVGEVDVGVNSTVNFGADNFRTSMLSIAGTMNSSGTVDATTLDVFSSGFASGALDSSGTVSVSSAFYSRNRASTWCLASNSGSFQSFSITATQGATYRAVGISTEWAVWRAGILKINPASPSVSGRAPRSLASTGMPLAMASISTRPQRFAPERRHQQRPAHAVEVARVGRVGHPVQVVQAR